MTAFDLATFVAFFLVVIGVSLWKSRGQRGADASESDYFLGGRSLTWPIIGISIVLPGRVLTVVFVVLGCITAPLLTDGVFGFIQQFQGFIWPGVVAAFLGAFLLPRAPAAAGLVALVAGPILYSCFQIATKQGLFANVLETPWFEMHFLMQVLACFAILFAGMFAMSLASPLAEPRKLPVREDIALHTEPVVKLAAAVVIAAVGILFLIFR